MKYAWIAAQAGWQPIARLCNVLGVSRSGFLQWRRREPSERDSYRKLIKQFRMTQSRSRKGNCWDNAPMESFFKTLKVEHTYRLRYTSREQARLDVVNWTEGVYNEKRIHSAINYRSPADFERSLKAA